MKRTLHLLLAAALTGPKGQAEELEPKSRATRVMVAPRYSTAIRLPEPITSVVIGDPAAFSAEHSDREPNLVFVKPLIPEPAQTNLLVSTTSGGQSSFLLVSRGEKQGESEPAVDFIMGIKPPGRILIAPSISPAIVPPSAGAQPAPESTVTITPGAQPSPLDSLLERQRRAPLPQLYGVRSGIAPPGREPVKAGVSEVLDDGAQVLILFSVVNNAKHPVQLMPPQVQLSGERRVGWLRRERWVSADQLPVAAWRLSQRRLGPGERADGVAVFGRPGYKQSRETMMLQVAESGSVDRPALAPIGFGIDQLRRVAVSSKMEDKP